MKVNVSRVLLSLLVIAIISLSFKALLTVQLQEVRSSLKEKIYKDFINKFVEEIDRIIEKIETETIPILKNNEHLHSSQEVEKWAMSIQGRKVINTMQISLCMIEKFYYQKSNRCSPKMTRTVQLKRCSRKSAQLTRLKID